MPKVEGTYAHSMSKEDAANATGTAIQKLLVSFGLTNFDPIYAQTSPDIPPIRQWEIRLF